MIFKFFRRISLKHNCFHIVAVSRNNVIGVNNGLPWRCREDLQFFKRTTQGQVVVMGRKTWESIPSKLKDRITIVISSTLPEDTLGVDHVLRSVDDIVDLYTLVPKTRNKKIYIIGGGSIYKHTLNIIKGVILSRMPTTHTNNGRNKLQMVSAGEGIVDNMSFIYYPTDTVLCMFKKSKRLLTAKFDDTCMFSVYMYYR